MNCQAKQKEMTQNKTIMNVFDELSNKTKRNEIE